jgi:hypothetical protein
LFLYRGNLKSIKFKDIELTIEKAKSEIYAKESQIRKMGEEIALILSESVAMQNRWAGDNVVLRREKLSENIITMLKSGNCPVFYNDHNTILLLLLDKLTP